MGERDAGAAWAVSAPVTVVSENGTAVTGMAQTYQAPTGWWKFASANRHKESLTYDMSIVGNDTVGVAVEVPIRLTSQIPANANSPITVTLAGNPIAYISGTVLLLSTVQDGIPQG